MPFYRPLSQTAVGYDRNLPWPVCGLAYVAAFMAPMSAGLLVGFVARHWLAAVIGLMLGIGLSLLNGVFMETFVEPCIARHQMLLHRGTARVLVNIIAFAWAFVLSGLSMLAPFVLFGSSLLLEIR